MFGLHREPKAWEGGGSALVSWLPALLGLSLGVAETPLQGYNFYSLAPTLRHFCFIPRTLD